MTARRVGEVNPPFSEAQLRYLAEWSARSRPRGRSRSPPARGRSASSDGVATHHAPRPTRPAGETAPLGTLPDPALLGHAPTFQGHTVPSQLPPLLPAPPSQVGSSGMELPLAPPMLSVPQKVAERILRGQFVDMAELLPDSWRWEETQSQGSGTRPPLRCPPITEIAVWVECYALMAGIIAARFPDKATHMFQYLRTIVRASRNFEGAAWVSYDSAFRRQVANTGSFDWGVLEPSLYNEAFTGRAKIRARCSYCLEDTHQSRACPLAPLEEWPRPPKRDNPSTSGAPLCGLFNSLKGSNCRFQDCRFCPHLFLVQERWPPSSTCQQRRRSANQQASLQPPSSS